MKKTLLAAGTLAATMAASAQSAVTLFGVVDASLSGYTSTSESRTGASVKVSRTVLANGAYNSSRLGFRGMEDLGGGLGAGFWLESPMTNDDGAANLMFSRRSTVSLTGAFGEVRAGRDNIPTFWNDNVYDPFGTNGVGANLIFAAANLNTTGGVGGFGGNLNNIRSSNSVAYFLAPNLGGFYGQVQYGLPETTQYDPGVLTPVVANNARTGRYLGGRLGYLSGPFDIAIAAGNSTVGDNYFAGSTDSVKTLNMGASYDFGVVKLMGEVSRVTNGRDFDGRFIVPPRAVPDTDLNGYLVGFTAPIGPALIRGSYSHVTYDYNIPGKVDASAGKLALGVVYNLSKRTALYSSIARVNNKNGAALTVGSAPFVNNTTFTPKNSTGYDIGMRVAF